MREDRIEEKVKSGRKTLFDDNLRHAIAEFSELDSDATIHECQIHIQ